MTMRTAGARVERVGDPAASRPQPANRVLERLRNSLPEIEARAAALDAKGAFPREDVRMLHRIGALETFGSGQATALELFEGLRLVGRANLSLGRIFEGHVNGARLVDWYGDDAQKHALANDLRAGRLFGVWNTEPSPGVCIVQGPTGPILSGAKSYATGAGFVDRAIITARQNSGLRQMIIADGAEPARADLSHWNVRGMRATCSGHYDLTGQQVCDANRLGQPGDYTLEPRFSAGAWRFTAVQLGGVERVLTLLRRHMVDTSLMSDPIHVARFGQALASARSAYLWVREAALRVEGPACGAQEIALVLMTRGVVEKAGLEVMEAAARTVGTKAFFAENPIDQACRDLALYLRQPAPDQALVRAATAFLERDCWTGDALW